MGPSLTDPSPSNVEIPVATCCTARNTATSVRFLPRVNLEISRGRVPSALPTPPGYPPSTL
jgi:hypothetical protein